MLLINVIIFLIIKETILRLDIISYNVLNSNNLEIINNIETILLQKGIIGVKDVPDFEDKSRKYIDAARQFSMLDEIGKRQYAPNKDAGETQGYELGAEWFKNSNGQWKIDDKKSSFYAFVPDQPLNKWPTEVDLKTSYLELGELIFNVGKVLLNALGLNEKVGLCHNHMIGHGRMLHYHKENNSTNENKDWCGAHVDHGIFTGLIPAYYFKNGIEVDEPNEAGLYIVPTNANNFEKIDSSDKSILLFQVGEFGQLISNDRIKATKHKVRKAGDGIERYTYALFYCADANMAIQSKSLLSQDSRYIQNQTAEGSITYKQWEQSSYERYRAR